MTQLPPEVFTLIGINLFLVLSLLTHLLGNRFPKALPYIYQVAALFGLGYLVVSKAFLVQVEESTRFWYSFAYLTTALTNVVAANFYVAAAKRLWTIAKAWFGAFSFPSILATIFFVFQYDSMQGSIFSLTPQISLVVLAFAVGIGLT
ncbi:MAG: hypothetical protein WCC63_03205, partial [Candidatus Bathyarchaeia archaeon]